MRRAPLLLGAAAALLGLVVAVVYFRAFGAPEVGSGLRTYSVESDTLSRLTFEVRQDPGATAVCTLLARAASGDQVGSALVRVGPSPSRATVVTYDLPTTSRPTAVEVVGCDPEPVAPGAPTGSATAPA